MLSIKAFLIAFYTVLFTVKIYKNGRYNRDIDGFRRL